MAKSMKSFLLPTEGHYKDYMSDDQCDALTIIENEFGLKGFAIFIKLWQKICGSSEGYCIKWNDRVCALFASELHVGKTLVLEIVNRLISEGLFDKDLYERFSILTSDYIQSNWYDVKKRSYKIEETYRLIEVTQNSENACKKGQNADKKGQNADKKPLIERNRIERNIIEGKTDREQDFSVVALTDEEQSELIRLSDRLTVKNYISKLSQWQVKNRRMSNKAYVVIRGWIEEEKAKTQSKASKSKEPDREPSYDLDAFEEFAKDFDLSKTMPGGKHGNN